MEPAASRAARPIFPPHWLHLLRLEDRVVPATHVWVGPATGGLWSNDANWDIGSAPGTGEAGGTIVQFNGGINSSQDILGLVLDQLVFTAGGNTIDGTVPLGLLGQAGIDPPPTNVRNDAGDNVINTTIQLEGPSGGSIGVLVASGQVSFNGVIQGNQAVALVEGSTAGTMRLGGSGTNTYAGDTAVRAGTLLLDNSGTDAAVPGNLVVTGTARFARSNQVADTATVALLGPASLLDLNGNSDTIGQVLTSPGGGRMLTGAGVLNVVQNIQINGTDNADTLIITGTASQAGSYTLNGTGPANFTYGTTFEFLAGAGNDIITTTGGTNLTGTNIDGGVAGFDVLDTMGEALPSAYTFTNIEQTAAPVLNPAIMPMLPSLPDNVSDAANTGAQIQDLLPANPGFITDRDTTAIGLAIVAADSTNGTWQYADEGAIGSWVNFPTDLSQTNALLLDPDVQIRFVPNANFGGTATIMVRGWDQTDGRFTGARADTTANGGLTAFSTDVGTISVSVAANAATPMLTAPAMLTGPEGSALALNISAAPGEADDALTITISGLPSGVTLSAGTITGGSVTLTPAQLAGLTLTANDNLNATLTVTATATDGSNTATAMQMIALTVTNAAPINVAVTNNGPITMGQVVTVTVTSATDPSSVDVAAGFRYAFATSQAALPTDPAQASPLPSAQFTFGTSGMQTIFVRVFDKDGGFQDATTAVSVLQSGPGPGTGTNTGAGMGMSIPQIVMGFSVPGVAGVQFAIADMTGDGVAELIVAQRDGRGRMHVRVFDILSGQQMMEFLPYRNRRVDLFQMILFDLTGDGRPEVLTVASPLPSGIFDGLTGQALRIG